MKKLRLTLTFYSSFLISSIMISLGCMLSIYKYGLDIFAVMFYFKISTLALTFYFLNSYKRNEFYYYQNLGVSKNFLWISTSFIDISLYLTFVTIIISIS